MKANAEVFAEAGFAYLGTSYSRMDCQAFVEACLMDVGISEDLPGSNAWYRAMTWVGTPEECKSRFGSIPKGALLFILKQDGNEPTRYIQDGIGNASHIGIKTGRSKGAIHSSASKGCVAESAFADKTVPHGGWNRVGLWDRFDYGEQINALLSGESTDEPIEVVVRVKKVIVKTESGNGVNFRKEKSKHSAYLGNIPDGTELTVTAEDGDWSQITWKGREGYVMSMFLAEAEPEMVFMTIPRTAAEALHEALTEALYGGGDSID